MASLKWLIQARTQYHNIQIYEDLNLAQKIDFLNIKKIYKIK